MTTVISVESLSKVYRLGQIGTGTFAHDLNLWWARMRRKPNPMLRIGEADHGNREGEEIWALKDVSFTVEQGEVLGIIGRNGAGKSTLLKILSRVTAPTSGKIKVKGRVASLLEVGTGFHPELTGRENIYLNGAILGMNRREIDRKFDEIVDFAEVEKFIDTPVKRYSSCMYVRLSFAVAAHLEPEILVVDEVLAVGDAIFQKKCLGKMGDVAKEGRTVLFVSHNMGAIDELCRKAILLEKGETALYSNTTTVLEKYISTSVSRNSTIDDFSDFERTGLRVGVIKGVLLKNGRTKQSTVTYKTGEPILLTIQTEFNEPVQNPSAGIYLFTDSGLKIAEYRTQDDQIVLGKISGRIDFQLEIAQLLLYPRKYVISVWVGDFMAKQDFDYIRDVIGFEIVPSESKLNQSYGIVNLPASWQIVRQ